MRVNQKDITISVFELNNNTFQVIGQVNQYTSLRYIEEYADAGSFELWAPIMDENANLFKRDRVIWIEGEYSAGIIEGIKETIDTNEEKVFDITGRLLNSLLDRRIVWNTYNAYNEYTYNAMFNIVNINCVNPVDVNRKIPYLDIGSYTLGVDWGKVTMQRTGDDLLSALQEIANAQECGFDISFFPVQQKIYFNVYMGINRAIGSANPVVLSSSMEDILESTYYCNKRDYKNIALVAGEGEGAERVRITTGDTTSTGYSRHELYVDARDIQSSDESNDPLTNGNENDIIGEDEEYINALINRGNEKLADCQIIEQFEASIRTVESQYIYKTDYRIGDIVTVQDERLGISVDVRITKVEQSFSDSYDLIITFGYDMPKLLRKLKTKNL